MVYTIAGIAVVVTAAGVAYYLTDSKADLKPDTAEKPRKSSKTEKRIAKKEKERLEQKQASTPKLEDGLREWAISWRILT